MMNPKLTQNPLIYDYLKKYQENPESRIFAPLAEAYRKAGLVDEAIEISREGLKVHPQFLGGRVALARALFDKKLYAEVAEELRDVVKDVPDNIIAQRLMGESLLMLGRVTEALDSFKMLLFFAPQDADVAQLVKELETQSYDQGVLVLQNDPHTPEEIPAFEEKSAVEAISQDTATRKGEWVKKVEKLQDLLQRVARYRGRHDTASFH